MNRRNFVKFWTAAAGAAVVPVLTAGSLTAGTIDTNQAGSGTAKPGSPSSAPAADDATLQSTLLFDLVFEKGPASSVDSPAGTRLIVGIAGGTFEGPKVKGTVAGPSGDSIVVRPDGTSVLDLRILLQTDDAQKIYMTCRGIAYMPQGGALFARILPMFETGAAKYVWMNNIVAAGVYRPMPGKVAYRVYQIL